MAHRRPSMFGPHSNQTNSYESHVPSPPSMLTPKGGSGMMYGDPAQAAQGESPDTFRRRTTPIVGEIEQRPSTLQEILAMLNGAQ